MRRSAPPRGDANTIGDDEFLSTALTLADVLAARERIGSAIYRTPCARSEMLSRLIYPKPWAASGLAYPQPIERAAPHPSQKRDGWGTRRLTGQSVFLKLENLQMTGSFKERGLLNRITTPSSRVEEVTSRNDRRRARSRKIPALPQTSGLR